MPTPAFITFTGADDNTPHDDLAAFAARHPRTEFGILFSRSRAGQPRYPSREWVGLLPKNLMLAAHVCGRWANELAVDGSQPDVESQLSGFGRVQINVPKLPSDLGPLIQFGARHSVEIILQCRDPEIFPTEDRVSWLYDASGGRGVMAQSWPTHPGDRLVGYAGGLGPATVHEALDAIQTASPFWIDMESKVRDQDDLFDLDLCSAVAAHSGL